MAHDLARLSRVLSHALRHEPWLYELELDEHGWAGVDAVLAALRQESPRWRDLTEEDIADVIRLSSKQRHELANGRIRALYGHSLPGKLRRARAAPPDELFHGTAPGAAQKIRQTGLLPMGRQYVHLSIDRATAIAVGNRKAAAPVILRVLAHAAAGAGVAFYAGNEKVWLADHVPADYIDFAEGAAGTDFKAPDAIR